MIEIKLRNSGQTALVSDRDADQAQHTWSWHDVLGVVRYDATRYDAKARRTPHELLARAITNAPDKSVVVHLDGNRLNCRRGNLLLLTLAQHAQFSRKRRGKSGLIGVIEKKGKFRATIQHQYLGRFETAEDAALAYDEEAVNRFGPSARVNFPRKFKVCHECHTAHFRLVTETSCKECAKEEPQ